MIAEALPPNSMASRLGWLSFDRWLPEHLRNPTDHAAALRTRFFLLMLILCILPLGLLTPVMLLLVMGGFTEYWLPTLGVIAVTLAQSATLFAFLKTGRINICSAVYAMLIFLLIGITAFNTGGWRSPLCSFMLALPFIINLVTSRLTGLFFSLLLLAAYTGLYLLDQKGYEFTQWLPAYLVGPASIFIWFITMGFLVGCLLLFDFSTSDLSRIIQQERNEWAQQLEQDELTRTLTATSFLEQARQLLPLHDDKDFAIISVCVGNLKAINQDHGFDIGDQMLRAAADSLCQVARPYGALVARYTPDTMVAFLPEVRDLAHLINLRVQLEKALNQLKINHDGAVLNRDFRIGIIVTNNLENTPEQLIVQAARQYASGNKEFFKRV